MVKYRIGSRLMPDFKLGFAFLSQLMEQMLRMWRAYVEAGRGGGCCLGLAYPF